MPCRDGFIEYTHSPKHGLARFKAFSSPNESGIMNCTVLLSFNFNSCPERLCEEKRLTLGKDDSCENLWSSTWIIYVCCGKYLKISPRLLVCLYILYTRIQCCTEYLYTVQYRIQQNVKQTYAHCCSGKNSQPEVSERGQDEVEERKRMAKELILGWAHTKVCTIGAVDFHRFRIDILRNLLGNF